MSSQLSWLLQCRTKDTQAALDLIDSFHKVSVDSRNDFKKTGGTVRLTFANASHMGVNQEKPFNTSNFNKMIAEIKSALAERFGEQTKLYPITTFNLPRTF